MALLKWSDRLSVNISEIDDQHKGLVSMINDLNDAMLQRRGKEILGDIVDGLFKYTKTHFKTEEKYFDKYGYPDADTHKKKHVEFTEKVSNFKSEFERGNISLSVEVMNFLSDWLQTHIKSADKQYGPFLNEKGVK